MPPPAAGAAELDWPAAPPLLHAAAVSSTRPAATPTVSGFFRANIFVPSVGPVLGLHSGPESRGARYHDRCRAW